MCSLPSRLSGRFKKWSRIIQQKALLGQAKMIFSFASQEKNVHPLPGLLGCFCPTRQGFYFDIIVPPGRVFITIYLQGNRLGRFAGSRIMRMTDNSEM